MNDRVKIIIIFSITIFLLILGSFGFYSIIENDHSNSYGTPSASSTDFDDTSAPEESDEGEDESDDSTSPLTVPQQNSIEPPPGSPGGGSGNNNQDTVLLGDTNRDGVVSEDDVDPFVLALSDPETYFDRYGVEAERVADINQDGFVDFDDIDAFVTLLGEN